MRARRLVPFLAATIASVVGIAGPAAAAPNITLSQDAPAQVLYGTPASVTLHAANPAGQPYGYNLSFRDVLPAGVSYVPGSAPLAPTVISNAPAAGQTTLLWENVTDLSPGSTYDLTYSVAHDPGVLDVGDTYAHSSGAYLHDDPRFVPDFAANGTAIPGSYTGSATASATSLITALEVTKDEPSPEGELLRGVHDQQTVYTVHLRNNAIRATTGIVLDDYLPAGLEYLACGAIDHTTDAATNPGSTLEYAGAPSLASVTPPPTTDCVAPELVETVTLDPDGSGPLPIAVYTHVRWTGLSDLAANGTHDVQYIAAVPIRENTMSFGGPMATPTPESLDQAANLDNNSGAETSDEQALTNYAVATGTGNGNAVSAFDHLTRTAEDIAIQKSVDKATIEQDDIATWALDIETSEYRTTANVRVTDTLPDGLCPLGPVNYEDATQQSAECAGAVANPSDAYTSATEHADGTWTILFDSSTVPALATMAPNARKTISFPTRARTFYQENFTDDQPVLARDAWTNSVSIAGADSAPAGIPHDEPNGIDDTDVSSASQEAGAPTIDKTVGVPSAGVMDCDTATYTNAVAATYGPGDRVCWRVRVAFPGNLDTGDPDVVDFLPPNTTYEPGSAEIINDAGLAPSDITFTSDPGTLRWALRGSGTGDVDSGSRVFEAQFSTIVHGTATSASGDILSNLQKVVFANSPGTTFPLRDLADFEFEEAQLSLTKGIKQVDGGTVNGPNVPSATVDGGDVVTFRLDLTESGGRPANDVEIWDVLPTGIACADVSGITGGGMCNNAQSRIEWTGRAVAASGTLELDYDVTVPSTYGPGRVFTNHAGVRSYTSPTNTGVDNTYIPASNIDATQTLPNTVAADDTATITLRAATVTKIRSTEVNESGNALASDATIGEDVTYTVTTTIPGETTLYGTATITDSLGARLTLDPSTVTVTRNSTPVSSGVTTTGNAVAVALTTPYVPDPGGDTYVITFTARVTDVAANVRGAQVPNTATLSYSDASSGGVTRTRTGSVNTRVVEPNLQIAKASDDGDGRVAPGDAITYTVTATNPNAGSPTSVTTAHDLAITDVLPVGVTPVLGVGNAVPPDNGTWDSAARTITWSATSLAPASTLTRHYDVTIDDPATAASTFTNTATITGTSIAGARTGERTAGSTTHAGYDDSDQVTLTIAQAGVAKSVSPTTATVGDRLTYTVDLTLLPNVTYYDVAILDALPDGVDFDSTVSVTCVGGCGLTATELPTVGQLDGSTHLGWWVGDAGLSTAARTVRVVYRAHVDDRLEPEATALTSGQTLVNTVLGAYDSSDAISGTPGTLPVAGDFDETTTPQTVTVTVGLPVITLDKDVSGDVDDDDLRTTVPGDTYTYSLKVRNAGTVPAYDVVVTDLPDAELGDVVPVDGASWVTDPWSAGDRDLGWTIPGPIAPGATTTLTYTATLTPSGALVSGQHVINTADVGFYAGVPVAQRDTDAYDYATPAAVTDDVVDLTIQRPVLTLAKTPDGGTGVAGTASSFTLRIENTGDAPATNIAIEDPVTDFTYTSGTATASPATGFSELAAVGGTLRWRIAAMAPGAVVTITVPVTLLSSVPSGATVTNTAAVHAAEDPTPVSDSATLTVSTNGDVRLAKFAPATAAAGEVIEYTLTASNAGPSDARNVVVTDTLPPELTLVDAQAPCTAAAQVITCALGTVVAGASRPVTLHARTAPDFTGPLTNTAVVATSTPDASTADDTASATTTFGRVANLRVTKVTPGADPGGDVTWTITVTNDGPSTAADVVLDDPLPAGTTYRSSTAGQGSCAANGNTVHCALGTLAPQAAALVTITAAVDPALAGQELDNVATAGTGTSETTSTDNAATAKVQIGPRRGETANLEIAKTASTATPQLGVPFTYTIRVRNAGSTAAPAAVVTDALAAPLDLQSVTASQGSCTGDGAISCALGTLAAGAEATVLVRVVPVRTGAVRNTASVDSAATEAEPALLTDVAGVSIGSRRTPLTLTKRASRARVRAGSTVSFRLTLRTGAHAVQDASVCDDLPAAMTLVRATGARLRDGRACWTWTYLPARATRHVTLVARVARGAHGGRIANQARATADNATARTARAAVVVSPRAARGGGVTG